jgi:hypothetical protein
LVLPLSGHNRHSAVSLLGTTGGPLCDGFRVLEQFGFNTRFPIRTIQYRQCNPPQKQRGDSDSSELSSIGNVTPRKNDAATVTVTVTVSQRKDLGFRGLALDPTLQTTRRQRQGVDVRAQSNSPRDRRSMPKMAASHHWGATRLSRDSGLAFRTRHKQRK